MNLPAKRIICAALLLSCLPAAQAAPAPTRKAPGQAATASPYSEAVKLYSQRQYALAAQGFAKVLATEPQNTSAALYLANAYYELHQYGPAKQYYRWIMDSYPMCNEANTAMQMLGRMGGTSGSQSSPTASSSKSESAGSSSSQAVDVDAMIVVVKPLADHPACTPAFIKSIKDGLNKMPKNLLSFMAQHGLKICITPSLIDRNPELRNTRPRGYEQGHTYKNTPAMYDAPSVVVCNYAVVGENEDNWKEMDDSMASLRHEFGHAVDHLMGYVSYKEKFRHIYYLDRARVDGDARNELSYYIQPGTEEGGPSECFAEAICCILGSSGKEDYRGKRDKVFERSFPNVIDYIKGLIKDINK